MPNEIKMKKTSRSYRFICKEGHKNDRDYKQAIHPGPAGQAKRILPTMQVAGEQYLWILRDRKPGAGEMGRKEGGLTCRN